MQLIITHRRDRDGGVRVLSDREPPTARANELTKLDRVQRIRQQHVAMHPFTYSVLGRMEFAAMEYIA